MYFCYGSLLSDVPTSNKYDKKFVLLGKLTTPCFSSDCIYVYVSSYSSPPLLAGNCVGMYITTLQVSE